MKKTVVVLLFIIAGLAVFNPVKADNDLPELNMQIVEYVESVMGEQVDRGECWDLANQALTRIDARWDGKYKYGREVNPKRREIYPGDIIQFKDVKVRYRTVQRREGQVPGG